MSDNSLRGDQDALRELKEQLCILWGNLEEHKSALLKKQSLATRKSPPPPSPAPESSDPYPFQKAGEQPNADSDDENEPSKSNPLSAASGRQALAELEVHNNSSVSRETSLPIEPVKNKAFTCCITQYGAKVNEDDPSKANAGFGKKWKRMFGLFGTQIK
jgi:protection-of-telomeres protein 1